MTKKATKIETAKRIFTIQGWILNGVPDYLILKQCVTEWEIVERQAKNLIARAYEIWHDGVKIEIDHKRKMKVDEMKQRMRNMKDEHKNTPQGMNVLLRYDKEINKLEGIIPEKVHIHRGDADNPIAAVVITNSDERKQLEDEIQKLLNKTK